MATTAHTGPMSASSRVIRMTVEDLRVALADAPGWAEVRIDTGAVQTAVYDIEITGHQVVVCADVD